MEAWLSLGSNLGDRKGQLLAAIRQLQRIAEGELKRCSGLYRTAPWGRQQQDDFYNAVAIFETGLPPLELLRALLNIEKDMGRKRGPDQWGPRCIDLDVLTCDDLVIHSSELELPHPRMHLRAFVLCPILELDPDFVIPGRGTAAACLAALKPFQEVARIGPIHFNDETGR